MHRAARSRLLAESGIPKDDGGRPSLVRGDAKRTAGVLHPPCGLRRCLGGRRDASRRHPVPAGANANRPRRRFFLFAENGKFQHDRRPCPRKSRPSSNFFPPPVPTPPPSPPTSANAAKRASCRWRRFSRRWKGWGNCERQRRLARESEAGQDSGGAQAPPRILTNAPTFRILTNAPTFRILTNAPTFRILTNVLVLPFLLRPCGGISG